MRHLKNESNFYLLKRKNYLFSILTGIKLNFFGDFTIKEQCIRRKSLARMTGCTFVW